MGKGAATGSRLGRPLTRDLSVRSSVRQALGSDQTAYSPGPLGVGIALKLPNHLVSSPASPRQPLTWKGPLSPAAALNYLSVVGPGRGLTGPRR